MSREFEKLEALLDLSKPSEREPQVDRGEAAKLAARWKWLAGQGREQSAQVPRRRPNGGRSWSRVTPREGDQLDGGERSPAKPVSQGDFPVYREKTGKYHKIW
jgi:hypothetical protein